jgi:serine/threonine-protein kinase
LTPTPDEAIPPSTASLGDTWTRPSDDMVVVYVPAGNFLMGSDQGHDDERPVHEVSLNAFWIDQTEVTNAQYNRCVADGECDESEFAMFGVYNRDDQPVVGVSWFDAEAYCEWAGGQLPTEAQWEYAARGEEGSVYPWGDEFDGQLLNFCDINCADEWRDDDYDDGFECTAPVGNYLNGASWAGAYDMAGNVWEWVADWYDSDYYDASPAQDPTGPASGQSRGLRGGSRFDTSLGTRSSFRSSYDPTVRAEDFGFRCASPGP